MRAADSGCTLSVSIQASVEGLERIFQFPSDPRLESVSSLNFTYSQHAISPSSWEKREFQRTLHLHNARVVLFMTQTLGMTITLLLLQLTNSRPEPEMMVSNKHDYARMSLFYFLLNLSNL